MSFYVLEPQYSLRGWEDFPFMLWDDAAKTPRPLNQPGFLLLTRCDGVEDLDESSLEDHELEFLQYLQAERIVRKVDDRAALDPWQRYHRYPCPYRRDALLAITGRCNYRCKHCLVSAPHAKFGHPSTEQLLDLVAQLAECGIGNVSLTGGEPLIREDFWQIVDALCEHRIGLHQIITNGQLVNDALLDGLEARGLHPDFQMSFDGVGWHDWLRGFEGAEAAAERAFRLLRERGYKVKVSMCLHRKNVSSLRDTVNYLAEAGVASLTVSIIKELGEWKGSSEELALSFEESLQAYLDYIPQFFADGAPIELSLGSAFSYQPADRAISVPFEQRCGFDPESEATLSCGMLRSSIYIGSDGTVAPCMVLALKEGDDTWQNAFKLPLREILNDSRFVRRCSVTVGRVRDANPECRSCEWAPHCNGGCRAEAYHNAGGYYDHDPRQCTFFKNGWFDRFVKTAVSARDAYLRA